MGYPMTYLRIVRRHRAEGTYERDESGRTWTQIEALIPPDKWDAHDRVMYHSRFSAQRLLAGDLRRLETDQRDEQHLALYAKHTGLTPAQVQAVLTAFFGADW